MGHIECGAKPLLVQNGTSNVKTASKMGHVTPLPTAPDLLSTAKVLKVLSFFSFGCSSSGPEWDFQYQNCLQNGPCDTSTNCPRPTEHSQSAESALILLLWLFLFWSRMGLPMSKLPPKWAMWHLYQLPPTYWAQPRCWKCSPSAPLAGTLLGQNSLSVLEVLTLKKFCSQTELQIWDWVGCIILLEGAPPPDCIKKFKVRKVLFPSPQ